MSYIELNNIYKKYKKNLVLENINLSIEKGERISILGPSGSGKSTLLNILSGIDMDFKGEILENSVDISKKPINKRNIVVVSQENLLFPHMNVYDNIAFSLKVRKIEESEIRLKVKKILEDIKLSGYENKKVNELSGGQKQRIAIARAIVSNPHMLLLDEAFSSLDTNLREEIKNLTIKLQRKYKITMILVTHNKEEAASFGNKIALLINGRIIQVGSPYEVFEKPYTLEIAKFMSDENFIDLSINNEFTKILKEENFNSGILYIRPKNILISSEAEYGFKGKVVEEIYLGEKYIYHVELFNKILKVQSLNKISFKVDKDIYIKINNYIVYNN